MSGDVVVRLHHIGSTAIPGPAKTIIDLLMEVVDLKSLDAATPAVEALGYEAMGEYGIPLAAHAHGQWKRSRPVAITAASQRQARMSRKRITSEWSPRLAR
jgi:GrpB-like predicted nucleotidyltransferase (UPF0157 family)